MLWVVSITTLSQAITLMDYLFWTEQLLMQTNAFRLIKCKQSIYMYSIKKYLASFDSVYKIRSTRILSPGEYTILGMPEWHNN